MNSSHVIVEVWSLSIILKKSCNSALSNGLLRANANDSNSFLSIVLLLFLSKHYFVNVEYKN